MHTFGRGFGILVCIALAAGIGGAQTIQSFPTPYSTFNVVAGPDGALWLTPNITSPSGSVGRITTSGVFSQISPAGGYFAGGPIVTGPDGNLWLQIFSNNQTAIAQLTTAGVSTVYALGLTDGVFGMTVGSDGAIWLAEGDRIGRITTAGVYTHFPVGNYYPFAIVAGGDGNLWYLAYDQSLRSYIGQITTAGVVKTFPFSGDLPPYAISPIAAGPDGNIWFMVFANTGTQLPVVGKITPAGVITTYTIPNTNVYDFSEGSRMEGCGSRGTARWGGSRRRGSRRCIR
jgi:virginiamycin B lyase